MTASRHAASDAFADYAFAYSHAMPSRHASFFRQML